MTVKQEPAKTPEIIPTFEFTTPNAEPNNTFIIDEPILVLEQPKADEIPEIEHLTDQAEEPYAVELETATDTKIEEKSLDTVQDTEQKIELNADTIIDKIQTYNNRTIVPDYAQREFRGYKH